MINEYLNQFIGYSAKQKVLMDAQKYLLEEKRKKLGSNPCEVSLVYVTDQKSKEILSIGGSTPGDIINDNFGKWWAPMNRIPTSVNTDITLIDILSVNQSMRIVSEDVSPSVYNNTEGVAGGTGTEIQIGSGSTLPARTDVDIETPFGVAPENSRTVTAVGAYNAVLGQVSVSALIAATGGAGTIRETTMIFRWRNIAGVSKFFLFSHDAIAPAVTFVAAQSVSIQYTWQL